MTWVLGGLLARPALETTMRLLNIVRIAHIQPEPPSERWLIEKLWGWPAVGLIGGSPKSLKSWLALEMAVAVASGQACLGHYAVHKRGPVLFYAAEDTASEVRRRVASIALARNVPFESLSVGLIVEPILRLDNSDDREAIDATLAKIRPRLLVLDPLVRIHSADENSSAEMSELLGFLRQLQRKHQVAIILVHHMRKSSANQPGQALRGSGDLHAWTDSAIYLLKRKDELVMHIEHRTNAAPSPMVVQLGPRPVHIEISDPSESTDTSCEKANQAIDARVLAILDRTPATRGTLRQNLRIRNETLGAALDRLEDKGRIIRANGAWACVPAG